MVFSAFNVTPHIGKSQEQKQKKPKKILSGGKVGGKQVV